MKRPCEMTRDEWNAHKNNIAKEWRKKNPDKAKALTEKRKPYKKQWLIDNKEKAKKTIMAWRAANKEKIRQQVNAWAKNHKDRARELTYRWRNKNRERFDANLKAYCAANRARLSEYRRLHRHAKPELYAKARKAWELKNKGRLSASGAIRRSRIRNATIERPELIKRFYLKVKQRRSHVCYYCGKTFRGSPDIDHIVPLSKGGKHSLDNLCVSCEPCNSSKGPKLIAEWKGAEGLLQL